MLPVPALNECLANPLECTSCSATHPLARRPWSETSSSCCGQIRANWARCWSKRCASALQRFGGWRGDAQRQRTPPRMRDFSFLSLSPDSTLSVMF